MSGNRANSAAIQRRTSSNSPPPTSKLQTKPNYKQTPPQQYSPPQYSPPQYSPQQYSPQPNPKLSFSDAIALITIRLGRVETFINNLPPLDQLEQYSSTSQPENNENMKIVDEAVFKNIVSRLEKIEQTNITPIQTQIPLTTTPIVNNEELQIFKEENSYLKEEMVSLKDEINELKNIILQLQNYTMTTNQKLCDIIFSNENDEKNISDELSRLLSQPETQLDSEGLDECISASLNGIIINEVNVSENETQNLNINI